MSFVARFVSEIDHEHVAHRPALDAAVGEPLAVAAEAQREVHGRSGDDGLGAAVRDVNRTIACSNMCSPRPNVPSLACRKIDRLSAAHTNSFTHASSRTNGGA